MKRVIGLVLVAFACLCLGELAPAAPAANGASPMFAYVDPGSAGFIIVSVLGFLAAAGYTIRMHFAKLKSRVRKVFGKGSQDDEEAEYTTAEDAEKATPETDRG